MGENKRKHLEFIQDTIKRMNTNSFMIKGWMIILSSGLFALAAKDANPRFVWVVFVAAIVLWIFDAFYLSQEREYRGLYDHVRALNEGDIDFSMDASSPAGGWRAWPAAIFTRSLLLLYLSILVLTIVASVAWREGENSPPHRVLTTGKLVTAPESRYSPSHLLVGSTATREFWTNWDR